MSQPRILAFAGSTRKDSYNKRLVRIAAQGAEAAGATVKYVELNYYPMPLFDEDLEKLSGQPESAQQLKKLMVESDGFLLASPEYNSSFSAVLKNTIDWVSRPVPGEPSLVAYRGKAVVLMSASPGGFGGLRGLVHVRSMLGNLGMIVLPDQIAVSQAYDAFDASGKLKEAKQQAAVEGLGATLATFLEKMLAV
jgi:NAD(P)H-dependent FMN reductase